VQVNAVIQQHGDLGVIRLVAQDRPDPIGKMVVTTFSLPLSFSVSGVLPQPVSIPSDAVQAKIRDKIRFIMG